MDLRKTSILPDGREAATHELSRLIHEDPDVLFVVLGDGREGLVARAGRFAGGDNDLRRVVWIRRPDDVGGLLSSLKGPPELVRSIVEGGAQAFSLSYSDAVADVIGVDETVDNVRVVQAYVRAEKVV